MKDVFICDAIRTPIGRYGGALSPVRADDLAVVPIRALLARNPEVAGGVESMSRAPFVMTKATSAFSRAAEIFDTTMGWRFVNPLLEK